MTSFLTFNAFAEARGEGLRPELRALFDRVSIAPRSELTINSDGMLQSGPDARSTKVAKERAKAALFPQASARRNDETNQNPGMSARLLRKHTT
jgi:hypothetical protein